jgi:cell division protein FtsB
VFLAATVVLVGVLFLFVFPTSSWLAQRRAHAEVNAELRRTTAENRLLEERVRLLQTPAEIERLAREKYNLIRRGEQAYAMLPAPVPPPGAKATGGDRGGRDGAGLWERVLSRVTPWF